MGQTLTNGVYLPDEGERNCYTGLAENWRALDYLIGGYNFHIADAVIHVSQADRDKWDAVDNKADASALTAHTGDTTIHVTAEDKTKWDAVTGKADSSALTAHTGDTTIHVTAEDKAKWDTVTTKANDADAVHKSGAETIGGIKTFTNDLLVFNSDTTAYASYLNLKNQRNVRGSTTDIGTQGLQYQDKNNRTLTMLESRVVSNGNTVFNINCYNIDGNNQPVSDGVSVIKSSTTTNFAPTTDNAVTSGRTLAKWSDVQTYKVNNLEPSSLGMPVDRGSRVDISAYFSNTGSGYTNDYIVPANGYILLNLTNVKAVTCYSLDGSSITNYAQSYQRSDDGQIYAYFPVRKNDKFRTLWYSIGGTVTVSGAFFIPCKGNV